MLRPCFAILSFAALVPLCDAFVIPNAVACHGAPGVASLDRLRSATCTREGPSKLSLRMGLFDGIGNAFKNALANEDLEPPPPDGLSQDPWLNGMRKPIKLNFMQNGELVAQADVLPGDRLVDAAKKAQVTLGDSASFTANDATAEISVANFRIPAPQRRNVIADDALSSGDELMDTGITAPVFTNYASRGEVRTVKVEEFEYTVELPSA